MDRVRNFAENATIHGVKDFLRIDYLWARWLWAAFFASCLGMMIYEMYELLKEYTGETTATQVSQKYFAQYPFPRMLFCPKDWINETKIAQFEIPKPMLVYALSLLQRVRLDAEDKSLVSSNLSRVSEELDAFLRDHNIASYLDFFEFIADDDKIVSQCGQCNLTKKQILASGVCIQFKLQPATADLMIQLPPRFKYTEEKNPPELKSLIPYYRGAYASDAVYVSFKAQNDFFAYDPILLNRNHSYVLRIKPTNYKRKGNKEPCVDSNISKDENYSQLMCYFYCDEKFRSKCLNCHYLSIERDHYVTWNVTNDTTTTAGPKRRDEMDDLPLCTSLLYDPVKNRTCSHVDENSEFTKCAQKCRPLCDEWVYDTTVIPIQQRALVSEGENADITLMLSYQVRYGETFIEEVQTYTWETFVSNVGGQLGLWMGASIVSLLQLIHFLAEFCFYELNACRRWRKNRGHDREVNGHVASDQPMTSSIFTTPSGNYNWSFQSVFDQERNHQQTSMNGHREQGNLSNGDHWNGVANGAQYY